MTPLTHGLPALTHDATADCRHRRRRRLCRTAPPPTSSARHNEGHGRRLTAAFEALEAFPALAESRNRLLRVVSAGADLDRRGRRRRRVRRRAGHRRPAPRQPGRGPQPRPRRVGRRRPSSCCRPRPCRRSPPRARTFDFFERSSVWDAAPERFRLHGVATQRAAERLAHRGRLRGPRPPDGHRAAARHRQARPDARLPGLPAARSTRAPARRRSASTASAASSASTTRWSAASSPAAGACRRSSPRSSSATTPTTRRTRPRSSASPTCSPTTRRAARSRRPSCSSARASIGLGPTELRTVMYDLPYPTTGRAAPGRPVPAVRPRGRGPQAPGRGQGLQADRATSSRSRRARCARTCTTSTASSARSTARRPS